jgi:hypothetical protein
MNHLFLFPVSDRSTSNVSRVDQAASTTTPPIASDKQRCPVSSCSFTYSQVGALLKHRQKHHPSDMGIFAHPRYP